MSAREPFSLERFPFPKFSPSLSLPKKKKKLEEETNHFHRHCSCCLQLTQGAITIPETKVFGFGKNRRNVGRDGSIWPQRTRGKLRIITSRGWGEWTSVFRFFLFAPILTVYREICEFSECEFSIERWTNPINNSISIVSDGNLIGIGNVSSAFGLLSREKDAWLIFCFVSLFQAYIFNLFLSTVWKKNKRIIELFQRDCQMKYFSVLS